jgi:hypothetical protein
MAASNRQNSQFSNQNPAAYDTRQTAVTPLMSSFNANMLQSPAVARTINHDDMSNVKSPNALNKSVQLIAGNSGGLPSYKS